MLGKYINHCEDSFTASIFTHLLFLPIEQFWKLLREACYSDQLPALSGELVGSAEFWPKWNPKHTTNTRLVEPDLFLRFADFDLIIEAKRWDSKQQKRFQWEAELQAYLNVYNDEKKPVYILALGGLHTTEDAAIHYYEGKILRGAADSPPGHYTSPVIKARWSTLLGAVKHLHNEIPTGALQSSQNMATERLCIQVIDLFAWHGFSTGKWFSDFPFSKHDNIATYPQLKFSNIHV